MRSYFRCFATITRLINYSMDQSRDQSLDRSQSINHSIHQSNDRSVNHSIHQSPDRSNNHLINQLINLSIIDQLLDQSINQSMLCSIIYSRADMDISSVSNFLYFFFFKIWARTLRTLWIQHIQLLPYTGICYFDCTLTINSGCLHHIALFYTQESVTNASLKVFVHI